MSEDITEENVESVIQNAIEKYFDTGKLVDAFFWRHCINLLNSKHKRELNDTS